MEVLNDVVEIVPELAITALTTVDVATSVAFGVLGQATGLAGGLLDGLGLGDLLGL